MKIRALLILPFTSQTDFGLCGVMYMYIESVNQYLLALNSQNAFNIDQCLSLSHFSYFGCLDLVILALY